MFRSRPSIIRNRSGVFLAAALAAAVWLSGAASAQVRVTTETGSGVHAGEFVVPLNKSQILKVDRTFNEILVGNPEIADVIALTDQSLYVLGKQIGSTNMTIYGAARQLIAVMDLVVSYDIEGVKAKIYEVMPEERIEARSVNGTVLLSGTVSSPTRLNQALAIAERFAPLSVTNGLSVSGSQQVMLQVRFAEINRDLSRALGLSHNLSFDSGSFDFNLVTGKFASGAVTQGSFLPPVAEFAAAAAPFGIAGIGASIGLWALSTILDDAETRGLVRTLAEPNLVAMSGDTASFLAGGEFPFPVAQEQAAITIEFKQFGIGLSFTPTVLGDGLINLVVAPEVSALAERTVDVGTFTVPTLSTRRANTTIELRDGQSFAIAGLLQSNYSNGLSQLPWAGDVPVLGALFRSAQFQRQESELVIIVTPRLVQPAKSPTQMVTPPDLYAPPNDVELFLFGRSDGALSGQPGARGHIVQSQGQGGISGQFGHIIR